MSMNTDEFHADDSSCHINTINDPWDSFSTYLMYFVHVHFSWQLYKNNIKKYTFNVDYSHKNISSSL